MVSESPQHLDAWKFEKKLEQEKEIRLKEMKLKEEIEKEKETERIGLEKEKK